MAKTIYIKIIGDSEYQWFANGVVLSQGSLEQLQASIPTGSRLRLLLPGEKVLLNQLPYAPGERRHLRKAAPYELEEHLIQDVEQQHFAFTLPTDNKVTIAVCDREWLEAQLAAFQQQGLELHHIVPEQLALPSAADGVWVLRAVDELIHVRYGNTLGFTVDLSLAAIALQQLLAEQGEPEHILLLGDSENDIDDLQNLLPPTVHPYCESRIETWPQSFSATTENVPVLDMRQGEYSNHLPVIRWWQQWQKVAMLAAVVVVVFAVSQWVQYNQLNQQGKQIRQQISETVSDTLSRTVVGDTRRQLDILRSELKKHRGGDVGSDTSSTALLAEVLPVFAETKGVTINSISFIGKSGELRLNSWAPSFEVLQDIQTKLNQLKYDAKFNASIDGDGQRGVFRIDPHNETGKR